MRPNSSGIASASPSSVTGRSGVAGSKCPPPPPTIMLLAGAASVQSSIIVQVLPGERGPTMVYTTNVLYLYHDITALREHEDGTRAGVIADVSVQPSCRYPVRSTKSESSESWSRDRATCVEAVVVDQGPSSRGCPGFWTFHYRIRTWRRIMCGCKLQMTDTNYYTVDLAVQNHADAGPRLLLVGWGARLYVFTFAQYVYVLRRSTNMSLPGRPAGSALLPSTLASVSRLSSTPSAPSRSPCRTPARRSSATCRASARAAW